jgi:secreted Zn-dependent insulinase-like peptidase
MKEKDLFKDMPISKIGENRLVALEPKTISAFQKTLKNPGEKNSLMALEFHMPQDKKNKHINKVLETYLSKLYFEELRTEKQVGYVVFAVGAFRKHTSGFIFLIQSDKFLPSELSEMTFEFLLKQRKEITELTDEQFNDIREGLLAPLRQEFNSLDSQSSFYFEEIQNHEYLFDKKKQGIEELNNLKKEDLVKYFEQMFFEEQRVLEMHLVSQDSVEKNNIHFEARRKGGETEFGALPITLYDCPSKFQSDHMLYRDTSLKKSIFTE